MDGKRLLIASNEKLLPITFMLILKAFNIIRHDIIGAVGRTGQVKNVGIQDFLGGLVVKNPLANARDKGLTPDLGRSHAVGQLSLCATTTEPAF